MPREKAPAAATRDMYLGPDGKPVPGLSTSSALAAGIPGEPAGLALLAEKYGKLPLKTSLQPAIRLARDGFPLYERLRNIIQNKQAALKKTPDASRVFLTKGGDVPANGYVIKQPDLARTLDETAMRGCHDEDQVRHRVRVARGMRHADHAAIAGADRHDRTEAEMTPERLHVLDILVERPA